MNCRLEIDPAGGTPDFRGPLLRCAVCGDQIRSNRDPAKIRMRCHGAPAEQLAEARAMLREFYRDRPFADVDGACDRLAGCVEACRNYRPVVCLRSGSGCDGKRVWFARLTAGPCAHREQEAPKCTT